MIKVIGMFQGPVPTLRAASRGSGSALLESHAKSTPRGCDSRGTGMGLWVSFLFFPRTYLRPRSSHFVSQSYRYITTSLQHNQEDRYFALSQRRTTHRHHAPEKTLALPKRRPVPRPGYEEIRLALHSTPRRSNVGTATPSWTRQESIWETFRR